MMGSGTTIFGELSMHTGYAISAAMTVETALPVCPSALTYPACDQHSTSEPHSISTAPCQYFDFAIK